MAIELPQDLKEKIFLTAERVTKGMEIRLVEKENLHLTLLFLGEIPEERIEEIKEVLKGAKVGEIDLSLAGWEVFPGKQKPEGIWIRVNGQTGKLFSLYKKIVDGLLTKGFELKKNHLEFLPHITVGRMKSGGVRSLEKVFLKGNFVAKKVALFTSELTQNSPIYFKLAEFEVK